MGRLREHDLEDSRCRECESAPAVGPCASCEALICSDCGVMSKDPVGEKVICLSCARLIADVGSRPPRRSMGLSRDLLGIIAILVVVAFVLLLLR